MHNTDGLFLMSDHSVNVSSKVKMDRKEIKKTSDVSILVELQKQTLDTTQQTLQAVKQLVYLEKSEVLIEIIKINKLSSFFSRLKFSCQTKILNLIFRLVSLHFLFFVVIYL